jgi:hypothetical protein
MNNSMLMIIAGLGLLWLLSKPKPNNPALLPDVWNPDTGWESEELHGL